MFSLSLHKPSGAPYHGGSALSFNSSTLDSPVSPCCLLAQYLLGNFLGSFALSLDDLVHHFLSQVELEHLEDRCTHRHHGLGFLLLGTGSQLPGFPSAVLRGKVYLQYKSVGNIGTIEEEYSIFY